MSFRRISRKKINPSLPKFLSVYVKSPTFLLAVKPPYDLTVSVFDVRGKPPSALCCLIWLCIAINSVRWRHQPRRYFPPWLFTGISSAAIVKNLALNQALGRSGAIVGIISFFRQKGKGLLGDFGIDTLPVTVLAVSSTWFSYFYLRRQRSEY